MEVLTTLKGQTGLPRYFASVFDAAKGRLARGGWTLSCRMAAGSASKAQSRALWPNCAW
jgi:hypothetical protein